MTVSDNPGSTRLVATSDTTRLRMRVGRRRLKLLHVRIVGDRETCLAGWAYYDRRWHCPACRGVT